MARIRTIKPRFWDDTKLSKVSRDARLLFIGMWNYADDLGVLLSSITFLKSKIFPYDKLDLNQVEDWIKELSVFDFIRLIEYRGEKYYHISNFTRHQVINRPNNDDINIPKDSLSECLKESMINPVTITDQSLNNPVVIPSGREGKGEGKEGKGGEIPESGFSEAEQGKAYLIPEMKKIWIAAFPSYTVMDEYDLPALRKIADFIFLSAGVKQKYGDSENEIKVLNTFQLIADQVNRENFWVNKPLATISKHIQEFYNKIKNPIDGTGKSKPQGNGLSEKGIKDSISKRAREWQQGNG